MLSYSARARCESSGTLPATHDAWQGAQLLRFVAPDLEDYDVYLCGPVAWMDSIRRDLSEAGVAGERIHSETFTL